MVKTKTKPKATRVITEFRVYPQGNELALINSNQLPDEYMLFCRRIGK